LKQGWTIHGNATSFIGTIAVILWITLTIVPHIYI
jgi:hypothetical protein